MGLPYILREGAQLIICGCLRGALAPLPFPSPSPFKERGIKGVRLTNNLQFIYWLGSLSPKMLE